MWLGGGFDNEGPHLKNNAKRRRSTQWWNLEGNCTVLVHDVAHQSVVALLHSCVGKVVCGRARVALSSSSAASSPPSSFRCCRWHWLWLS